MAALGDARIRSVTADAELKELELARARREVISAADVEHRWMEIVTTIKARMLAIGTRVTPLIVGEVNRTTIQMRIDDAVKEALTELARDSAREIVKSSSPDGASASAD